MKSLSIVVLCANCLLVSSVCEAQSGLDFKVKKISEKVIFVEDPGDGTVQLAIASSKGIVVFNTHWSEPTARKFRTAIAEAFGRDDFAFTINMVDRLDYIGGNGVYLDTSIIGHESFKGKFTEEEVKAEIKRLIEMWRWKEGVSKERLVKHKYGSEAEKREREWMNTCKRRAEELETGFSLVLPSISYKDQLTLYLGDLTLELIYFGKAGYDGMTVAIIPEERLVIIPGFIMHPQHLAPHPHPVYVKLDVPRWINTLEEILGDGSPVEIVICGIGDIWSKERALTHLEYIRKLWEGVKAAEAEGLELSDVQEKFSLDGSFAFVKEIQVYKDHGDDWVRPQHRDHVRGFYLQHKKMASAIIEQELKNSTIEAAVKRFRQLCDNGNDVYFDEPSFNAMGYYLMNSGKIIEAIEIFKMNVKVFPESANAYDSLGEAYLKNGDKELAITNYKKSLDINPNNENAKKVLKEIQK